jgi:ADP-ribosylglycohydrolase
MSLTSKERATSAFYAHLCGDVIGSQAEFLDPDQQQTALSPEMSSWLLQMRDDGPWHTLAGQPTEEGEISMLLLQLLAFEQQYDSRQALQVYHYWLNSEPFAVSDEWLLSLRQAPQLNFSVTPLARQMVFALLPRLNRRQLADIAMSDCALTHPTVLSQHCCALYAMLLSELIHHGTEPLELYQKVSQWARDLQAEPLVLYRIEEALFMPPVDIAQPQVPILAALQLCLFMLLYGQSLSDVLLEIIKLGGDTGTHCALVAPIIAARDGESALQQQWLDALAQCRPQEGVTGVNQPRPEAVWPRDIERHLQAFVSRY